MPGASAIEWTEASWNPATGCTKVSPGCAHCYAETFAERWRGIPGHAYEQGFDLKLWPQRLEIPLRWRKPKLIFVNSMSDLFHEEIPREFIREVFNTMRSCDGGVTVANGRRRPHHTFQVLTKRPERMLELARSRALGFDPESPPENVWFGTTIENRRYVSRADLLRETPAAVRFISAEPLLGPLVHDDFSDNDVDGGHSHWSDCHRYRGPELDLTGIDWLICGGESGPGYRRFDLQWARDLRDACAESGTAFFLKQLGGNPDKRGGEQAVLDGRRYLDMPGRPPVVGSAVEPAQGVLL